MTGAQLARGWMAKARTQVSTPADIWLLARMAACCVTLRLLKHVVPLPRLVLLVRQLHVADVHRHELDAGEHDNANQHGEKQEAEKGDAALARARCFD